ncbi:MAG: LSM domain-containing protein [Promethearchaeota archaeon]
MTKRPLEVLQRSIESEIIIRLKDGTEYKGLLVETDNYMNMVLSDAKEMDRNGELIARFGEIFIRGNNILFIKPDNAIL